MMTNLGKGELDAQPNDITNRQHGQHPQEAEPETVKSEE